MTEVFISDLHLDTTRPDATAAFMDFLKSEARDASALYILGDLFETWIGDDARNDLQQAVIAALREYASAGRHCWFTHGNRDFLIGTSFAADSGVGLLEAETVIQLGGEPALLMHGDELCTDDRGYQRLRAVLRNRFVQWAYLALSVERRQKIAQRLRHESRRSINEKPALIVDVNQAAVETAMRRHKVRRLIHGHTHRPAIHEFLLDGKPAQRIVLGDWYDQASVLSWNESGPQLSARPYP